MRLQALYRAQRAMELSTPKVPPRLDVHMARNQSRRDGEQEKPRSVSINFKREDEEDKEEFYRQLRQFTKDNNLPDENKSEFAKFLLVKQLRPDPTEGRTMRALLEDVKEALSPLDDRMSALESQIEILKQMIAKSVFIGLVTAGGYTPEAAEHWVRDRLENLRE